MYACLPIYGINFWFLFTNSDFISLGESKYILTTDINF